LPLLSFCGGGFFCLEPDIDNKIHSRTCRIKAALSGTAADFLRDCKPGGSGFAPSTFKIRAACFPPSPLMTGYETCLILHGKKRSFFCPKNIETRENDTFYQITDAFGFEII